MNTKFILDWIYQKNRFNEEAHVSLVIELCVVDRRYDDIHDLLRGGLVTHQTLIQGVPLHQWAKNHKDDHMEALVSEFTNN